ncbi:MAG TPA: hypothetical protein VMH61_07240 [Candidatus Acidoferrales bacterium]|nr:hypothetical protein [Candidatus Acidoferrales bacterium]
MRLVRELAGLALLAAFLFVSFGDARRLPFINDDFVFLDRTRAASFGSLWGLSHLAFQWYRPWSRELHYWAMQRVFGADPAAFHTANLVLAVAVLAVFAELVHRAAGPAASAWALAQAAAMSALALPLLWVAGVQDLWMLFGALLAIRAWIADRRGAATLAFALALLSKETACVLPAILLAWDLLVARRSPGTSLRRLAAPVALVLAWAAVHPHLGGRLWHPVRIEAVPADVRVAPALVVLRSLLLPLDLDVWPRPDVGLVAIATAAWRPVLLLLLLVAVRWPSPRRETAPAGTSAFGLAWAGLAWLPTLLPGLGWHGYYGLLGAFGLLLAAAPLVARRRALAFALVALTGTIGVARAVTRSTDWGESSYQRRAGALLVALHDALLRLHPTVPSHARLYFAQVPDRVGFLAGDGPALRVWYRDPTLSGGYFSSYRPRAAGAPQGPDFFFRLDTLSGWIEYVEGPEDPALARARDPNWEADQEKLARVLLDGGDWSRASGCYEKLFGAHPDSADYAFRAAACRWQAGDSIGSMRWLARAAAVPGASAEIRGAARSAGVRSP